MRFVFEASFFPCCAPARRAARSIDNHGLTALFAIEKSIMRSRHRGARFDGS